MIRLINRRTEFGDRAAIVATCDRCERKIGGDFSSWKAAESAVDEHECEGAK